jgi:hypothetical protein
MTRLGRGSKPGRGPAEVQALWELGQAPITGVLSHGCLRPLVDRNTHS